MVASHLLLTFALVTATTTTAAAPFLAPPAATAAPRLERLPRLPGAADLTLWRSILPDRIAYGGRPQPVFARAHDRRASLLLHRLGIDAAVGRWVPAELDAASLLVAIESGVRLELRAAHAHKPLTERGVVDIGAIKALEGVGMLQSRSGRGVLVGIIDTGIDLTHPAFMRPDGSSRIVAVWDQDIDGDAPAGFGYGHECRARSIAAATCGLIDPMGHGTHVAGIAAGGALLPGVAWDADIAVVRSEAFTRLADAVSYLIDLAAQRRQPVAVNISVGGHYGAHDGRTPLESYLAELAGPGRLLVAAAGNDGGAQVHLGADLDQLGRRVEVRNVPRGAETVVELCTDPVAELRVAVELWIDGALAASGALQATDTDIERASEPWEFLGATVLSDLAFGREFAAEHGMVRHVLLLDRTSGSDWPPGWSLALRLSGHGRVDGWVSQSAYAGQVQAVFGSLQRRDGWAEGDDMASITVPATAAAVIAVGSYTIATTWQSQRLGEQRITGESMGELASYSSRGPTLLPSVTGLKPELCAPGTMITSARVLERAYVDRFEVDNLRVVMQGTSMAAPFVTGVLALMLEADPSLGPRRVRQILRDTARTDLATGKTPNDGWGYGKIDAYAAVVAAQDGASGCAAVPPGRAARGGSGWVVLLLALLVLARERPARSNRGSARGR